MFLSPPSPPPLPLPCPPLPLPCPLLPLSPVGVMQFLLTHLELVRQGQYISPRVLQIIFNYLEQA